MGGDSHTPHGGSIGMLCIGVGGMDVATAMTGVPMRLKMPRVIKVNLTGALKPGVNAKKVILEMLRRVTIKGGLGNVYEYAGPGAATLEVPQRATITNMGAELGATTSIFPADEQVRKFMKSQGREDEYRELLPDEVRLNKYGKFLRSTSLDELPELWNILKGDLSIVGPRPQLVRDMVFMNEKQRQRHLVRQGLTGLAQVNGRNNISWEEKFQWDLKYAQNVTFSGDMQIIFKTIGKVLKRSDTVREGTVSDMDFGDYLLSEEKINREEYDAKQKLAKQIIENYMKN